MNSKDVRQKQNERQTMSALTLIGKFKKGHAEIIDALKECRELGMLTKKGKAKLMSVKSSLLEHLKEEEEKLYTVLYNDADQNMNLKEQLEIFAKDWGNVYTITFEIFDRYDKGVSNEGLMLDFGSLFTVLRQRMRNEEDFLYGEYERIMTNEGCTERTGCRERRKRKMDRRS